MNRFLTTVDQLREELGPEASVQDLLALLKRESADFGIPRSGDPTPALRLLAFDGILTEMLAK